MKTRVAHQAKQTCIMLIISQKHNAFQKHMKTVHQLSLYCVYCSCKKFLENPS